MFIKNQKFKDEETLLEMLFDFGIGDASPALQQMIVIIDNDLAGNESYINYRDSLTDEDDKAELYIEERDLRLAETLMEEYESFEVTAAKLYAVKGAEKVLLYEIDML